MAGYGIIGDDSYGTELPETTINDEVRQEQLAAARFSKSKEFKALKEHFENRIAFYQTYLPDGRPLTDVSAAERESMWVIANAIIGEFNAVINEFQRAADYAKREGKR